ncbi:glutamine-hydrolyzing carbamoyl-phosphate synthase small subunit [Hymenobacter sp. BT186]|uniref:Carbamoyl phosphate synthase small chain n=1 Tax=Hymenobacter telluris TaxID=2816474 RepID=A0A939EV88_9BACT|nr:glutamine-hydrolyzing carbamoyl-phosphate synthase small subunit [Hymenobacter telluris]MBO0357290.1 glutamine-hydrolyzing carbamoyl-phosphate synthase small subunit [Hymenobacter telluris]MBW3373316.1 glutamine-hydrolyzing carbamoyl-phosphate synthase small subunit [Hymenobacter norwichensis]
MENAKSVKLILEDGTEIQGQSFGAFTSAAGEVVFSTAMTGYPENLTDPSFAGQILVLTYPMVGNYGVPGEELYESISKIFESDKIHIAGLVVNYYSEEHSHWNAAKSLGDWLKEYNIPGIFGVDTRMLTKILREKGAMLGKIVAEEDVELHDPNQDNLVAQVSPTEVKHYGNGQHKIVLVDCGTKTNIIRCFLQRDVELIRVPWDYDFTQLDYDGLFLSNGPGDPKMCTATIQHLQTALGQDKPIFGICLGSQLMGLAAGGDTFKLKYGHRSHNQPVKLTGTQRSYITSQNHGFAVDTATLPAEWDMLFENLNDGTCEGIKHKTKPFFSTQFHPEAAGGPEDTEYLFDDFLKAVAEHKGATK